MKKNKIYEKKRRKRKLSSDQLTKNPDYLKPIIAICFFVIGLSYHFHLNFEKLDGFFGLFLEAFLLRGFGLLGSSQFSIFNFFVAFFMIRLRVSFFTIFGCCMLVFLTTVLLRYNFYFSLENELLHIGYIGQFFNDYAQVFFGAYGRNILFFGLFLASTVVLIYDFFQLGSGLFKFFRIQLLSFFNNCKVIFFQEIKGHHPQFNGYRWLIRKLFFKRVSDLTVKQQCRQNDVLMSQSQTSNPLFDDNPQLLEDVFNLKDQSYQFPKMETAQMDKNSLMISNMENFIDIEKSSPSLESNESICDQDAHEKKEQNEEVPLNEIKVLVPANHTVKNEDSDNKELVNNNFSNTTSLDNENELYQFPPIGILNNNETVAEDVKSQTRKRVEKASLLEEALQSFNVKAKVVNITPGPSVTRYELKPGDGVKISKITALSKDIALKLAAPDVRIEAPIPGKSLVGIEVPNDNILMITLRAIMESSDFYNKSLLTSIIGKTISGESILMDLAKMPHVLIAGATGSGKSVCINTIILSLLMKTHPNDLKLLMIDPKKVELSLYEGIPHLIAPVVTDPRKAAATLKKWALIEMEQRYDLFSKLGVKDINSYNKLVETGDHFSLNKENIQEIVDDEEEGKEKLSLSKLPYIVVVIDELADLMMVASQEVEQTICRLAQMARATGIHLVIATQRPSVNVITGLIKANVPSRISFYLQSQIDSRTILDMGGAEKLIGKGDMLYSPVGSFKPMRVQGVYVSESEVKGIVEWLKKQGSPNYEKDILTLEPLEDAKKNSSKSDKTDELFDEAKQLIISTKYASTSYLQRKLRIGYNRAARIMDELESSGVISEYVGEKKPRNVV